MARYRFADSGDVLTARTSLRFRSLAELEESLSAQGFAVTDVLRRLGSPSVVRPRRGDHRRRKTPAGSLSTGSRQLLLPEQTLEGAQLAAERLRAAVEALGLEHPGGGAVTASVGVAGLGSAACTPDELFELADRALYRAKEGGRNRVEVEAAGGAGATRGD